MEGVIVGKKEFWPYQDAR